MIGQERSSYLVTEHRGQISRLFPSDKSNRVTLPHPEEAGANTIPLKNAIPSDAIPSFPASRQPNMSTHSQHLPSKNSLSITLTEPFVILRTVDAAGSQPLLDEFAPPSVLRGLLALDLSKASKISNIQIELQATSCASWSEGMSMLVPPSNFYEQSQGWALQRNASFIVPLKSSSALHQRHLLDGPFPWSPVLLIIQTTQNIDNLLHLSLLRHLK